MGEGAGEKFTNGMDRWRTAVYSLGVMFVCVCDRERESPSALDDL